MEVHSSIKPSLKQYVLIKGTTFAGIGIFLIACAGIFLPVTLLKTWGIYIFLTGILLITIGLLPYRRLCRLEMNPDKIVANTNESLSFFHRGRRAVTIPESCIEKIEYVEEGRNYGIGIRLTQSTTEKVIIHVPNFKRGQTHRGFDLYFPYFSKRAFNRLTMG